jgi:glycine cleavage system regulatory protein
LALPAHVTPDEIRRALEALADEIMVDIRTESEATT